MSPNVRASIPLYPEASYLEHADREYQVFDKLGRRDFSRLAAAALLGSSASLFASTNSPHKVSIALAARNSLYHLPLVLAEQLGFLRSEGLVVEWVDTDSGHQAVQMAFEGHADVVSGAFEHVLDLQAAGNHFRAFVLQARAPQISVGLVTRRAVAMKKVSDLKALKMGISSLNSATHWMALHWMQQAGLASDAVQFVELGGSTASVMESIRSGAVDSLCHVDPILHYLEQKNDLRVLADTRTLANSQRMFGGPVASACLFSRVDFQQSKPELAQALATGVVRALNWLKTAGPTDILKNVPTHHWMGDRALYLGALDKVRESYSVDGVFGNDALQTAWRARARRIGGEPSNSMLLAKSATNQLALVAKRKAHL